MPAGREEVLLRGGERQPPPHRIGLVRQRAHQPVEEGGVGHGVGDRGARGQHPVLHAQVRDAAADRVHRPVPAVHRAVVQDELRQPWHAAGGEHLQRVLLPAQREQGGEVADVLLEQAADGVDPALAEPGPWPDALCGVLGRAAVGGLEEERRPGLVPQLAPEDERRVRADGDLRGGCGLRRVPGGGEPVRRGLEVELHRGAGGLGCYGLEGPAQPFGAGDVDGDGLPARRHDLVVQQHVTVIRRERVGRHLLGGDRRQYSRHHQPGAEFPGHSVRVAQGDAQFFGQIVEHAPGQPPGGHIEFQGELSELRLEIPGGHSRQHFVVDHSGRPVGIGEAQFHLETDLVARPLEAVLLQQRAEGVETRVQPGPEPLSRGQVEPVGHDLLPHRAPPGSSVSWARSCPGGRGGTHVPRASGPPLWHIHVE